MSDGGDFDGGSIDIDVSDEVGGEGNRTTGGFLSTPKQTQIFISCILLICLLVIDVMINVVFFSSLKDDELNIILIPFVEFGGVSLIYAIPAIIIPCFNQGKPCYIYAICNAILSLIGVVLIIIGVIICFIVMSDLNNSMPIVVLSVFNCIILFVRLGLTYYNFIRTKGFYDENQTNEMNDNQTNQNEEEVDMAMYHTEQQLQNNQNENGQNESNTIINDTETPQIE